MERQFLKETTLKDATGKSILTVKLIGDRSHIFINGNDVAVCRTIPVEIPINGIPKLQKIDSISDLIDLWNNSDIIWDWEEDTRITPELDFFVNLSNLQVWVEHNFDSRLIDYRLSFPLLKALAEQGNQSAKIRFKEELLDRYLNGSAKTRQYLKEEFLWILSNEELYSFLPYDEQEAMILLKKKLPSNEEYDFVQEKIDLNKRVVVELDLKDDITHGKVKFAGNLTKLPKELIKLKNLKMFKILLIKLEELPPWLDKLPNLEELEIRWLTIIHPFKNFRGIPSLKRLKMKDCTMEALHEDLGTLTSLKELEIFRSINYLPESIGNLKSLKKLDLRHNSLKKLPSSFSKLETLKYIDLSENQFAEFPKGITSLKAIEYLDLGNNKISKLPKEIKELKNLKNLSLYSNKFDCLPQEIGEITTLENINIGNNKIKEIPESFGNLHNLHTLIIGNNISYLPFTMITMKSLSTLHIESNPLETLPDWLAKLPSLKRIYARNTRIPKEKLELIKKKFHHIQLFL